MLDAWRSATLDTEQTSFRSRPSHRAGADV